MGGVIAGQYASLALQGSPSFSVMLSSMTTNAGVQLTLTATALTAGGQTDTAYRGQIKFTATDAACAPGTAYRYTYTAADNGVHAFTVSFNTAGAAQTITITDTANAAMTGTSPSVTVAETYLHATFGSGTVVQGVSVNLTVQAKDAGGNLVTGFRNKVQLASTWDGVQWNNWGSGVTVLSQYTFTAGDAGSHVFTPKFTYAGDQTATVTDTALAARTVTTSAIAVTNSAPDSYSHHSTPSGLKLADGSYLWAHLGVRGRLYVRRNVGTPQEPLWRAQTLVREVATGNVGADTPSLVRLGSTIALFHTYTDGTSFQVWVTTSSDDGATWSAPTQVTTEAGHVQRIQAVAVGSTAYVFWSRQDTNRKLFYQTTTDFTSFTTKTEVPQPIGVPVSNTTSNFGITRLSSGTWVLGWLWTSVVNENQAADSLTYPTVHVATSSNLTAWTSAVELNLPWSRRLPESVALAQDPETGLLYAAYEEYQLTVGARLIITRTSTDGVSWNARGGMGRRARGRASSTPPVPARSWARCPARRRR